MSEPVIRQPGDVSEKVTAATLAAAVGAIAIWAVESAASIDLPQFVEAAVVTVLVALAGYFIPDRR